MEIEFPSEPKLWEASPVGLIDIRTVLGAMEVLLAFWLFFGSHLTSVPRPALIVSFPIQQQKNTCAHNNTHKAHANGIKKKKRTKHVSQRGMDPKFLRNQKFCKKYNNSKRSAE